MTGEMRAAADPTGLWASLSTFQIGSRPSTFERRLAADNCWSETHAARVIREYRRFLYLASVASFEVTPSKAVDAAWHLHLEDEPHYREALCERLLGRMLEHRPGSGDPLEEERFRQQYRETLALYANVFGPPPADIWPAAPAASSEPADGSSNLRWFLGSGLALCGTVAAAFLQPAAVYIGLGLLLALAIGFAIARAPRRKASGADAGHCGGGCSGGSSDNGCADGGDGGCAASCGGGCGGGGD